MHKTLLALLFVSLTSYSNDKKYDKYCNTRFSFCIEYPRHFKSEPPPENGDCLTFISPDKQTKVLAFGSLAVEGFDQIEQEFKISTKDISLTYKLQHKDWFVFSGKTKDNNIIYRKTRKIKITYLGQPDTFVFQTLMIEYPFSQATIYEPYCLTISKSLE
jgi:hypothetical protein